jgi:hypothetical protein
MTKTLALAVSGLALLAVAAPPAMAEPSTKSWDVTIENLTPAGPGAPGSQPLSPPLFATHSRAGDVWTVGHPASNGVAAIAEDANNAPLQSQLGADDDVLDVFTGAGGPIASGQSRTYEVETSGNFNRLSVVTMLVNTNDGFTGLDTLHLNGRGRERETAAYDAGSERNNEDADFIPGPCCGHAGVRDLEGGVIAHHPGILGVGDLMESLYGWTDPVARITVERTS